MSQHTIINLKFPRPDDQNPDKTYWDDAGQLVLLNFQLPADVKVVGRFNGHGRIVGFTSDRDGGQNGNQNAGQGYPPQQQQAMAPPPGYPQQPGYAPQGYPPQGYGR